MLSSRIPQWESDAVSEGPTLRNEDNAFLPLSLGRISLLCEFGQSHEALCQAAEKTLKQHTWVSSLLQVHPSLMFNCGIRVHFIHQTVILVASQGTTTAVDLSACVP
jgi:hypothetical protein